MATSPEPRVLLIEGLPGTGKTSLAEWLCKRLADGGRDAAWAREEAPDHPVIDRATRRTAAEPGYADRCIARWQAFARRLAEEPSPEVFVLEGCLFQSTVRFLIEHEHPAGDTARYLVAVESALSPLAPRLVYLTQPDPEAWLRDALADRKGEATVAKIAAHSATTPFAVRRGLEGRDALVGLYTTYRVACDALVARTTWPVLALDAARATETSVRNRARAFLG
jgi:hypothetical protein